MKPIPVPDILYCLCGWTGTLQPHKRKRKYTKTGHGKYFITFGKCPECGRNVADDKPQFVGIDKTVQPEEISVSRVYYTHGMGFGGVPRGQKNKYGYAFELDEVFDESEPDYKVGFAVLIRDKNGKLLRPDNFQKVSSADGSADWHETKWFRTVNGKRRQMNRYHYRDGLIIFPVKKIAEEWKKRFEKVFCRPSIHCNDVMEIHAIIYKKHIVSGKVGRSFNCRVVDHFQFIK